MSHSALNTWQDVQTEILDCINSRKWKPGDFIPKEAELAREFGCARATVNRALRAVADSGLIVRRRKAGTQVVAYPVRKATFAIPIIRQEIESQNRRYSYTLVEQETVKPPAEIRARMRLAGSEKNLHMKAIYLANGKPYVFEDRWINLKAVPTILNADLSCVSANEWLIANAPYTHGDLTFAAKKANTDLCAYLAADEGDALFVLNRTTWNHEIAVTDVTLTYHSGYDLHTSM